jgi:hypothetical protein
MIGGRRKQIMERRSLGSDEKAYSTGFNWFSEEKADYGTKISWL